MSITLIDAAEGRVLGTIKLDAMIDHREPEPTIADDIAEILRLFREMKEDSARINAMQEAFWARCTARIVERLTSST